MSEPTETETVDLTPYAVFGLYRHGRDPMVVMATDKAGASRQFHDRYPGFDGTVLWIKSFEELTDGTEA